MTTVYPGDGHNPAEIDAAIRACLLRRINRAQTEPAKACPACGEHKPAAAYSPDLTREDGSRGKCRACEAASAKPAGRPVANSWLST